MRCVYGRQLSTNASAGGVCTDGGEGVIPPTNHQTACIFEVSLETCYKIVGMISVALLSSIDDAEQDASILRMALKPTGLTAASIAQAYKKRVHDWFPILSEDQLISFATPSILGTCHGRDGILLLCMALVSQQPCGHPGHGICCNLYKAAKQSFLLLQTSSRNCIQTLQIGLLLSLFEYGHGLDQESKLSIAACTTMCESHKFLSDGSEDGEELIVAAVCRRAVVIMDWSVFGLLGLGNLGPASVWVNQYISNHALNSLTELPKYPIDIQISTDIKTSTNNGFNLLNEPAWPDEHILGESDRSLSNFEILFRVASIVREAIQYLKNDATIQSPASSYTTIESRLRNVCFALIQAAGPNSVVFCDSIALALRYDFAISLLGQVKWN